MQSSIYNAMYLGGEGKDKGQFYQYNDNYYF